MSLMLDDQLCFALHSTSNAMHRAYREPLRPLGLTYPQYLVMLVLWQQDEISVSEIGTRLYLDSATLTPLLKRLEAINLVERKRALHDERSVIVSLTPAGRDLKRVARRVPMQIAKAMNSTLDDIVDLKGRLDLLRSRLLKAAESVDI
jgi:DNA-binding MarR family transcriptional regulator